MRPLLFAGLFAFAVLGCDSGEPAPAAVAPSPIAPSLPALTPTEVCEAYVALPTPEHVTLIAASATASAIKPSIDGKGMSAQIIELRAETGPVENGQRRIDGITLNRKLTLQHDGTAWKVSSDDAESRSEIFYVRKTPDHDPRTLFGAQVVERYGPKGGTPCALPQGHVGPKVTSAEICPAYAAVSSAENVTTIAVSAKPGFTRPSEGDTYDPPTLSEGQAAATVTELRVESDAPETGTRKHHLVTATHNVVLERAGETWKVASTQPVFRRDFLQSTHPAGRSPKDAFGGAEIERYRPTTGNPCVD